MHARQIVSPKIGVFSNEFPRPLKRRGPASLTDAYKSVYPVAVPFTLKPESCTSRPARLEPTRDFAHLKVDQGSENVLLVNTCESSLTPFGSPINIYVLAGGGTDFAAMTRLHTAAAAL